MRRADDRRSASVMIRSSIRWSLAGNEVDWMMKASEPRTFSWISTKISMSAKRRTTALVSGRSSPLAMAFFRPRVGIAGNQLDGAVLGRHRGFSPGLAGDNVQHIGFPCRTGTFRRGREYQADGAAGNPLDRFSRAKWV